MSKAEQERNFYRQLISHLLIGVGICLMLVVISVNAMDYYDSTAAVSEFKEAKSMTVAKEQIPKPEGIVAEQKEKQTELPTDVLALLSIEKINLEEAVKEGTTSSVISSALGHMSGTALPGESGNCCIAGHRNYVFGKYFNRLDEVESGDIIELETLDTTYIYTVYDSFVVEPDDMSVVEQEEGYQLTLITCTPLFIGSHRLIIKANLTATA